MEILVLRVAPSNTTLRKQLKMWAFPLKIKEKKRMPTRQSCKTSLTGGMFLGHYFYTVVSR